MMRLTLQVCCRLARDARAESAKPKELWLIVDGSGSMHGSAEQQARQAADFFVRDLPVQQGKQCNGLFQLKNKVLV